MGRQSAARAQRALSCEKTSARRRGGANLSICHGIGYQRLRRRTSSPNVGAGNENLTPNAGSHESALGASSAGIELHWCSSGFRPTLVEKSWSKDRRRVPAFGTTRGHFAPRRSFADFVLAKGNDWRRDNHPAHSRWMSITASGVVREGRENGTPEGKRKLSVTDSRICGP